MAQMDNRQTGSIMGIFIEVLLRAGHPQMVLCFWYHGPGPAAHRSVPGEGVPVGSYEIIQ